MAMWDEGWLPKGWVRGEPLYMHNSGFRGGPRASFSTYVKPYGPDFGLDILELVIFHEAETMRVQNWLRWYYDLATRDTNTALRICQYHNIVAQLR